MSNNISPTCPISYGPASPFGTRRFPHGDPWVRDLEDLVNQIPPAHDLRSAILALNRMNNIIMMINRGEPVVNNLRIPGSPDVKIKGEKFKPNYGKTNWVIEGRDYVKKQKLHNPDNEGQYIEIDTIKYVSWYNPNTSYRLTYYSKTGVGSV